MRAPLASLDFSRFRLAGLGVAVLLWVLSAVALWATIDTLQRASAVPQPASLVRAAALLHLHRAAAVLGGAFSVLQVGAFALLVLVLLRGFRLGAAPAFFTGAVLMVLGDGVGLFGLLVWLRLTLGTG